MTTPKKKTTESDERAAALADERTGEDADALGMEKARIAFGKTEQSLQMKVYRSTPEGDEALHSFEYDPDVHTEDFLRERFGPGKYRVRFRDLTSWKYLGQFTVRLGAVSGEPLPGAAPPVQPASGGFDPLPYFMHEAEKKSDQFNQVMLAILARGGSGGDGGGSEALVALIKAQSDLAARAEERNMALLQKLLDRPAGGGGVEAVMKALELGMTAVSDIKSDSEGGWVSVLRGVAKELGPALTQLVQKQTAAAAVPPAPASGATTPNAPAVYQFPASAPPAQLAPEATSPTQEADVFKGLLTRYAPIALQEAKGGSPPVEFAGSLLDSIGVSYHSLFDSLTSQDLVSLQPELGSVQWKNPESGVEVPWIDEVVRLLHTRDWGDDDLGEDVVAPPGQGGGESA